MYNLIPSLYGLFWLQVESRLAAYLLVEQRRASAAANQGLAVGGTQLADSEPGGPTGSSLAGFLHALGPAARSDAASAS